MSTVSTMADIEVIVQAAVTGDVMAHKSNRYIMLPSELMIYGWSADHMGYGDVPVFQSACFTARSYMLGDLVGMTAETYTYFNTNNALSLPAMPSTQFSALVYMYRCWIC